MFRKSDQNISSGDNAQNYQAARDINQNNYGISYSDAKAIALDVFKENFLKLSDEASRKVLERAEIFLEKFLNELHKKDPMLFNSLREPSMQMTLYSAQREYSRTGDKNVGDLLIHILVERSMLPERNIMQIVLEESIDVIPKLTQEQLNVLTLVFLLRYTVESDLNNLQLLDEFLTGEIKPFVEHLTNNSSSYQHIEYCNCGSVTPRKVSVEGVFLKNYKVLFNNGFELDDAIQLGLDQNFTDFIDYTMPCLHNEKKFQIIELDDHKLSLKNVNADDKYILKKLSREFTWSKGKVRDFLISRGEFMKLLISIWDNSDIKSFTLTSVGITIAHANYYKKTGISLDLSIWIK